MEKDDLAILLRDAPAEEVDRVHRLAHEWCVGPDSSFPVQLALLTRAQWQAAASVPRSVNDSRKWLEQHLAEYRRRTAELVEDFAATIDDKKTELNKELKTVVEAHAKATQETTTAMHKESVAAQYVARAIQQQVEACVSEWKRAKSTFAEERRQLETACAGLDERLGGWIFRCILGVAVVFFGAGALFSHFFWRP